MAWKPVRYIDDYNSGIKRGRIARPPRSLEAYIGKIYDIEHRTRTLLSVSKEMKDTTPTGASPKEAEEYFDRFIGDIVEEIKFFGIDMRRDSDEFHIALHCVRSAEPAPGVKMLQSLENLETFWNEAVDKASSAKRQSGERLKEYISRYPQTYDLSGILQIAEGSEWTWLIP
ncbi:hypothetical protein QBC45DRAFT_340406 [Copromyces sp. CBS 386.78]|nr:hypothetical protein QBC45DRAFT_340406 [Copromyces sp. CBS 386.78]